MTTSTQPKLRMPITRNGDNIAYIEVGLEQTVSVQEVQSAAGVNVQFYYNLLAGTQDTSINDAYAYTGKDSSLKLPAVMGKAFGKDQLDALRKVLAVKPAIRRKAWAMKVKASKRTRELTLTGLRAAINKMNGKERAPSALTKEAFIEAWDAIPANLQVDPRLLKMYDLAVMVKPISEEV